MGRGAWGSPASLPAEVTEEGHEANDECPAAQHTAERPSVGAQRGPAHGAEQAGADEYEEETSEASLSGGVHVHAPFCVDFLWRALPLLLLLHHPGVPRPIQCMPLPPGMLIDLLLRLAGGLIGRLGLLGRLRRGLGTQCL